MASTSELTSEEIALIDSVIDFDNIPKEMRLFETGYTRSVYDKIVKTLQVLEKAEIDPSTLNGAVFFRGGTSAGLLNFTGYYNNNGHIITAGLLEQMGKISFSGEQASRQGINIYQISTADIYNIDLAIRYLAKPPTYATSEDYVNSLHRNIAGWRCRAVMRSCFKNISKYIEPVKRIIEPFIEKFNQLGEDNIPVEDFESVGLQISYAKAAHILNMKEIFLNTEPYNKNPTVVKVLSELPNNLDEIYTILINPLNNIEQKFRMASLNSEDPETISLLDKINFKIGSETEAYHDINCDGFQLFPILCNKCIVEYKRLSAYKKLSPLEKHIIANQFPMLSGIKLNREHPILGQTNLVGEITIKNGIAPEECRVIYVEKEHVSFVQKILADAGCSYIPVHTMSGENIHPLLEMHRTLDEQANALASMRRI